MQRNTILMPFQGHSVLVLLSFERFHLDAIKAYTCNIDCWAWLSNIPRYSELSLVSARILTLAAGKPHSPAPWFLSKLARTPKRFDEKSIWKLKIKPCDWWSLGWTSKLAMTSILTLLGRFSQAHWPLTLPSAAKESGRHIRLGRNLEAVKDKAAAKASNKKKKTEDHGSRFAELTSCVGRPKMHWFKGYVWLCGLCL